MKFKKRLKDKDKKGDLNLSFGMIFSLILIVVFIAFAFWAITKFLAFQKYTQIVEFKESIQEDIDNLWQSTQGMRPQTYSLPGNVDEVCIADDSLIFFEPLGAGEDIVPFELKHIDLEKTLNGESEICFAMERGKLELVMIKDFGEALVTIKRRPE